ncbi:peptidase domain-containing ABC transporter [Dokdonia genika]|uniref:Peptidase domain-containing ABC transporter n=1 Tax=Dokdonia genika TaxID=308113 RepID=A0ABV9L7N7_9FLAO
MKSFPFYPQLESKDCGPACLQMVLEFYGLKVGLNRLREISETNRSGSNLYFLSQAVEKLGFKSLVVKLNISEIKKAPLPAILHWNQNHFVVIYKISHRVGKVKYHIADPAIGMLQLEENELQNHWLNFKKTNKEGIVFLLEKPLNFSKESNIESKRNQYEFKSILTYLLRFKPFIWQLMVGLIIGSLLQLVIPFLTQSIVDIGIRGQNLNFIYVILGAQIFLYLGRISIQVIRNRILLHLSIRINIAMISSFFMKLMKLPISYFDKKLTGDLLQRINDHRRIQNFIAVSSLDVIFSATSIFILSIVLAYYSLLIFTVFFLGSILYGSWVILFLKKRKVIDNTHFNIQSEDNSKTLELINAMQDIKLFGIERTQRQSWEQIQAKLYNTNLDALKISQYQDFGAGLLNEVKNLIIIVIAAKLVIDAQITLGVMLAISYIIGQLNSPISLLLNFIRDLQDALISFRRVSEIHNLDNEEKIVDNINADSVQLGDIDIVNISFRYPGIKRWAIKDLTINIPKNKVTAIVGHSGSGKTTLLKLLLHYYNTYDGKIKIGNTSLNHISPAKWRVNCGVILQDSHIFNETIRYNITLSHENINKNNFRNAIKISNIEEFVDDLALGFATKIGREFTSLSSGQYQRILIARAIYRNPKYLFFDEATSTLDTDNERLITDRLKKFFQDKTVVIIAHRLSTVINADQILVLNNGELAESGTHDQLIAQRANYYSLVKNQLDLSS